MVVWWGFPRQRVEWARSPLESTKLHHFSSSFNNRRWLKCEINKVKCVNLQVIHFWQPLFNICWKITSPNKSKIELESQTKSFLGFFLPFFRQAANSRSSLTQLISTADSYNHPCSPPKPQLSFHLGLFKCRHTKKRRGSSAGGPVNVDCNKRSSPSAAAAYFKHQRLISRSSSVQALWLVERALVVENSPTKVELSGPVHSPVTGQVVFLFQGADSQVAAGNLHLLDVDTSSPSWDNDHGVIFCRLERGNNNR